jgi:hypothetical protein
MDSPVTEGLEFELKVYKHVVSIWVMCNLLRPTQTACQRGATAAASLDVATLVEPAEDYLAINCCCIGGTILYSL